MPASEIMKIYPRKYKRLNKDEDGMGEEFHDAGDLCTMDNDDRGEGVRDLWRLLFWV